MRKIKQGTKVVCAMSGGVDSSVAAALLKRAGFNVIGVFMKFWSAPKKDRSQGNWNRCCSPEAESRARKVAKILKIPFYIFNFEKEFKKRVVDYFLEAHKKGTTPNPCVVCNKEIKFGLLLKKAKKIQVDFLATGHYVKKSKVKNQKLKVIYRLLRGTDKSKDQSYFLWQLNQNQLKHILFPLGSYSKKEVRGLAKKFKLSVLNIPESQEICFIKDNYNDFLARYFKPKPGKVIDTTGKIIGQHQGLWFYTIGQRKGIGFSGGSWYVMNKDFKKNILVVTKKEKDLEKRELIAGNINWISGKEPKLPLEIKAKIRYRHKFASAVICHKIQKTKYKIVFKRPQRAIASGQSVVFYKGQELLGGGIII